MPELVFEIWGDDPKDGGGSMFMVHPQNDKVRAAITPDAVLLHRFSATSSFAAFRHKNEWFGCARWEPPEGVEDHHFTEEEAREQHEYLSRRNL